MPVMPVNKVVDKKKIIGKRRAKEEEGTHIYIYMCIYICDIYM
jgi:hypothetical protein